MHIIIILYVESSIDLLTQANAFRNVHKIYVSGADIPDAVASFEDLYQHYDIPSYLKRSISNAGYHQPTPIQMQAIPLMLHVSTYSLSFNVYTVYTYMCIELTGQPILNSGHLHKLQTSLSSIINVHVFASFLHVPMKQGSSCDIRSKSCLLCVVISYQSREVLACAPTGSGKTAAFIIPVLVRLKVTYTHTHTHTHTHTFSIMLPQVECHYIN